MNKKPKVTVEEIEEIRKQNKIKLEAILRNPDYMEELGRKYYGEHWRVIFAGERHPNANDDHIQYQKKLKAKRGKKAEQLELEEDWD